MENSGWRFSHFFWVNNPHGRYDLEWDTADTVQPEMMHSAALVLTDIKRSEM